MKTPSRSPKSYTGSYLSERIFISVGYLFSLECWMEIKIINPEVRPQSQWYPENSWVSIISTHPPPLHKSSHRSARRQTIARLLGTANEYRYPLVLTHIALLSLQCWSRSWVLTIVIMRLWSDKYEIKSSTLLSTFKITQYISYWRTTGDVYSFISMELFNITYTGTLWILKRGGNHASFHPTTSPPHPNSKTMTTPTLPKTSLKK